MSCWVCGVAMWSSGAILARDGVVVGTITLSAHVYGRMPTCHSPTMTSALLHITNESHHFALSSLQEDFQQRMCQKNTNAKAGA